MTVKSQKPTATITVKLGEGGLADVQRLAADAIVQQGPTQGTAYVTGSRPFSAETLDALEAGGHRPINSIV